LRTALKRERGQTRFAGEAEAAAQRKSRSVVQRSAAQRSAAQRARRRRRRLSACVQGGTMAQLVEGVACCWVRLAVGHWAGHGFAGACAAQRARGAVDWRPVRGGVDAPVVEGWWGRPLWSHGAAARVHAACRHMHSWTRAGDVPGGGGGGAPGRPVVCALDRVLVTGRRRGRRDDWRVARELGGACNGRRRGCGLCVSISMSFRVCACGYGAAARG